MLEDSACTFFLFAPDFGMKTLFNPRCEGPDAQSLTAHRFLESSPSSLGVGVSFFPDEEDLSGKETSQRT